MTTTTHWHYGYDTVLPATAGRAPVCEAGCGAQIRGNSSVVVAFAGHHDRESAVFHAACWREYRVDHPLAEPITAPTPRVEDTHHGD